jgi:hypothetical protein
MYRNEEKSLLDSTPLRLQHLNECRQIGPGRRLRRPSSLHHAPQIVSESDVLAVDWLDGSLAIVSHSHDECDNVADVREGPVEDEYLCPVFNSRDGQLTAQPVLTSQIVIESA